MKLLNNIIKNKGNNIKIMCISFRFFLPFLICFICIFFVTFFYRKIYSYKGSQLNKVIRFGTTLDLSESGKFLGDRVIETMNCKIKKINKKGIKGRILDFDPQDDKYDPALARKNIEYFLENNIDIIVNPVGSPTLMKYLDLIKEKKILVLFPIASASFRDYNLEYLIRFRAPIDQQGYLLAKHAVENLGAKKIAVFYQDDEFGKPGFEGAAKYLKKKEKEEYVKLESIPYPRNPRSLSSQIKDIKKVEPDSIIFFSSPVPTERFLRELGVEFLAGKNLLGNDDLAEVPFQKFLERRGINFIVASIVPNPQNREIKIVSDFNDFAKSCDIPLDIFSLEAYIGMRLFVYLLEQIEGEVTKEALVNAAKEIKGKNFEGLLLDFNPETNQLLDVIWLTTSKEKWDPFIIRPLDDDFEIAECNF